MKSLKYRLKKHEVTITNTDWNKYDDRLMKAVERGEADKVAAVLGKKGIVPTKLDVEGRSAFHLAATRGQIDCLNLILGHNVDVTASDATGKNALHLASRNGHFLCVQKLLQFNCPVGNVDLQGRTALHDAVMAGCSSSVKLLCDSGASVNASDFEGRTPLVLATHMCHPRICQLLLERGADIAVRDKQNKTPLILGCEFGCKDAVEVLLKSGADVKALDASGNDAYHYARLSKNQELVALVKGYLDRASRDKEAARIEQWKRQYSVERTEAAESSRRDQLVQDLERQNESLQEGLRKYQQEQKTLLDKVNVLQQQLSQEKMVVENTQKEKEQLKILLNNKEREEGSRGPETVKVQLRSTLGEYSGQSVIKGKENLMVKQAHSLDSDHNPPMSRSLSRGAEKSPAAVGWDVSGEVDALRRELEAARRRHQAAEEETSRLQSALNKKSRECQDLSQSRDAVQKQAERQVQELEEALSDVQKRMLDSECKVKQLQTHVVAVKEHLGGQAAEELRAQLLDVKAKYEGASAEVGRVRNRLKQSEKALEEYKTSESQLAAESERLSHEVSALSGERDELAEALLQMEAELKGAQLKEAEHAKHSVPAEKFDNMKNLLSDAVDEKERQLAELRDDYDRVLEEVADLHRRLDAPPPASEEQNASLKRKLVEVTAKSQTLIQEVEQLSARLHDDQEVQRNMAAEIEELEDKLVEAGERCGKAEAQVERLQQQVGELDATKVQNGQLTETMRLLEKRCEEREKECEELNAVRQEQVEAELSATLGAELASVRAKERESGEELKKVKEGNDKLKEELEKVLQEHRDVTDKLNAAAVQAQNAADDAAAKEAAAREEVTRLTKELEAQKTELDAIQDAVQSKFVQKESSYSAKLDQLNAALQDVQLKYDQERAERERRQEEAESVRQRLDVALAANETLKEAEQELRRRHEEEIPKVEQLEEQNAASSATIQSLQERLRAELTRIATYDTELKTLNDAALQAQADCKKAKEAQQEEAQRGGALQKELQEHREEQRLQADAHRALEAELAALRAALREEEENGAQRAEDVSALQSELLQATQALQEIRCKEEQMVQLQQDKQQLQEQNAGLNAQLRSAAQQRDEAQRDAGAARAAESSARSEMDAVAEKGRSIEREVRELKERYDESLATISQLQRRNLNAAQQTEAKDKKITELLTDVDRLKQALNGLSQLAYTSNTPNKRQTQHIDTLQAQIKNLQQQLADAERQHREVVSIYRTHLLSAAQGHMDEDVQAALLQIIRMRQEFVC